MGCDAIQAVSGNHGKLRGEPRKGTLAMRSWCLRQQFGIYNDHSPSLALCFPVTEIYIYYLSITRE